MLDFIHLLAISKAGVTWWIRRAVAHESGATTAMWVGRGGFTYVVYRFKLRQTNA